MGECFPFMFMCIRAHKSNFRRRISIDVMIISFVFEAHKSNDELEPDVHRKRVSSRVDNRPRVGPFVCFWPVYGDTNVGIFSLRGRVKEQPRL